ncbi:unnamed protein product [Blepharisma stoltei]|uniref:Mitochondrial carrier protein n=1 Tax=Blepharisma stoltei TaxID=1481888 RepID=A0AAU9KB39_9CILI|nr:unnamed protein product [Blepharisma stoltei]
MQQRSSSKSSIAGFCAGSVHILLFPLEKIKLHMIVSDGRNKNFIPFYKNSIEVFKTIHNEGLRSLYRGCHFQLSISIAWAVYFYIYETMKKFQPASFRTNNPELYKFTVAAESAFISNFIINPLMVMKTRAILLRNSETWFKDTIEAGIKTWKVDGIRGFWRGYLIGNILSLNGALTMYLYEFFKENLHTESDFWRTSMAGGLSKLGASTIFFPVTLIKIRLQQEQYTETILKKSKEIGKFNKAYMVYEGLKHCIGEVWKTQGLLGFYRGLGITLIKIVPTQAIFFVIYEATYKMLT